LKIPIEEEAESSLCTRRMVYGKGGGALQINVTGHKGGEIGTKGGAKRRLILIRGGGRSLPLSGGERAVKISHRSKKDSRPRNRAARRGVYLFGGKATTGRGAKDYPSIQNQYYFTKSDTPRPGNYRANPPQGGGFTKRGSQVSEGKTELGKHNHKGSYLFREGY